MKKQVNYKVNGEEWNEAKTKAFNKIVKEVKADGFREGKMPREVFEKKYGTADINSEAMATLLDKKYVETMEEEKLVPIIEPKLEIVSLDDNGFEANVTFILEPEVKLGDYKGLNVEKEKIEVTKEEIASELENILNNYAELVSKDGEVEEGDTVIIDFKGFKNNEEFDGGSAQGYSLEIGSHSFIPGFEEGIIGMKKDESKDINLTFPEDYMASDLAGEEVVFNVKVNEIKSRVIPELNAEFFEDLGIEDVSSKEDLEKIIEEQIKEGKEYRANQEFENNLLEKACENMTIELDEELIIDERNRLYADFLNQLKQYGLDDKKYFEYTGMEKEEILKEMTKEAEKLLKNTYLLKTIVKEENITVSNEEVEEEINHFIEHHNMTREEVIENFGEEAAIEFNLLMRKGLDFIKENN